MYLTMLNTTVIILLLYYYYRVKRSLQTVTANNIYSSNSHSKIDGIITIIIIIIIYIVCSKSYIRVGIENNSNAQDRY